MAFGTLAIQVLKVVPDSGVIPGREILASQGPADWGKHCLARFGLYDQSLLVGHRSWESGMKLSWICLQSDSARGIVRRLGRPCKSEGRIIL